MTRLRASSVFTGYSREQYTLYIILVVSLSAGSHDSLSTSPACLSRLSDDGGSGWAVLSHVIGGMRAG